MPKVSPLCPTAKQDSTSQHAESSLSLASQPEADFPFLIRTTSSNAVSGPTGHAGTSPVWRLHVHVTLDTRSQRRLRTGGDYRNLSPWRRSAVVAYNCDLDDYFVLLITNRTSLCPKGYAILQRLEEFRRRVPCHGLFKSGR